MEVRIDQFVGLRQSADELITSLTHASEAHNVRTDGGRLMRAHGFTRYAADALAGGIGTLAAFYERDGSVTNKRLVAVNDGGIYTLSNGAWQSIYAAPGSGRASALNYQHNGTDILLVADGARGVLTWDGGESMAPLSGCDRKFSSLALHYERIWGSGIADDPDAVYWSRAFDPEDWRGDEDNPDAGGGVVLIPTWNGGRVRSIRTLFNDVLVFKDEDLYRIVGTYPGNYEVVRVPGVVGPVAPDSIVWAADACYFLGRDGLCAYNGVTVALVGGGDVKGIYARINRAAAGKAAAAIWRDRLYLALPIDGSSTNNAVLEVDLTRGAYLLSTGYEAASFLPFEEELLMADGCGRVYVLGAGDDHAGQRIDASWRTPWQALNKGMRGRFMSLNMFASGTIDLTLETDESRVTRRVKLGDALRPATVPLGGRGRRFCLTIRNVDGGAFCVAPGLTISIEKDD